MDYYLQTGPDGCTQQERDEEYWDKRERWNQYVKNTVLEDLANSQQAGWTDLIYKRLKTSGINVHESEVLQVCQSLEKLGVIAGERVLGQGIRWYLV